MDYELSALIISGHMNIEATYSSTISESHRSRQRGSDKSEGTERMRHRLGPLPKHSKPNPNSSSVTAIMSSGRKENLS